MIRTRRANRHDTQNFRKIPGLLEYRETKKRDETVKKGEEKEG